MSDAGATALGAAQRSQAIYFDGQTSRKRNVSLRFADRLDIVERDSVIAQWPFGEVRRIDGPPGGRMRLGCATAPALARLEVDDAAAKQQILLKCPALEAGHGGRRYTARIVFWSLAAACSIFGLAVYGIPIVADRLAPFVPQAWENRVGEAVDRQIVRFLNAKACTRPDGQAALATLVDRLKDAGGITQPLRAEVVSSALPNAFALPGGRIYLLNGLLKQARGPDEIAGVLGHELGHIKHRDSLRKIIETGGTSFLVGLLFGDITGAGAVIFVSRSMLDASYSREAERNADAFALQIMRSLGRSATALGELLLRVTGTQANRRFTILASHPLTEERLEAMEKDRHPVTGPELLSADQWRALQGICR
jgi:Zn-dependent protease with chaperone function